MKYLRRTSYNINKDFTYNLLKDRGIITDDVWEDYISPKKENENSPFTLDNMAEGIKLLNDNLNKEILVIADADFDGFSSAALIWNFIKELNSEAKLTYLLPEGKEHGFQTKMPFLLEKKRADLIIMPDAGSNDHEEMKQLKEFGYSILLKDHHLFDFYDANAVVINNQGGEYENRDLSGVGVVYKFIEAYCSTYNLNIDIEKYLDLVACGETGDCMNMNTLENRYYLKGLSNFKNPGLRALIKQQAYSLFRKKSCDITNDFLNNCVLSQIQVAFYIVPLINALIRVGTNSEKEILFQAFIEGDKLISSTKRNSKDGETETIAEQAARMCSNVRNRQNKEKEKAMDLLDIQIVENCLDENKILVLNADELEVSNSLTGLIAMGICSKYNKPTIVGRTNNKGEFKGSIRNNGNSELKDFRQFLLDSNLMEYVEGHPNSAGQGIKEKNIDKLIQYANNKLKNIDFHQGVYEIDFQVNGNCSYLSNLIFDIDRYKEVFGQNNPEPIILIENVPIKKLKLVGADKTTINFSFNGIKYVKFKDTELAMKIQENKKVNIIGQANINEWNGTKSPQIFITDIEFCDDKLADF